MLILLKLSDKKASFPPLCYWPLVVRSLVACPVGPWSLSDLSMQITHQEVFWL